MVKHSEAQEVVLRLQGITRRFGATVANDGIDLTLHKGEVVALLGENGAGKTTLMNILFGQYAADSGTVEVFGQPLPAGDPAAALAAGLGMVHQHFTLADNLTVLENIQLGTVPLWRMGLGRSTARAKLVALSQEFGLAVDPDARVGDLSVGERQRVEILKALYRDVRILILDEPTAVLTPQESDALFSTLRKAVETGLSIIFISHKLHEVMAASSRVVVLRHGRLAGEVATRDTSREALAAMMVGGEIKAPTIAPGVAGPALLRLEKLSTAGAGVQLNGADLVLNAGEITGIAGVSGNGQSLLSDLISGLVKPASGIFEVVGATPAQWSPRDALAAGIGRIPEDRHKTGTISEFSLTENAILETFHQAPFSRAGLMNRHEAERTTKALIEGYDVRCQGPDMRIRLLSGGNMQKLILGRVLEQNPKIVLANQPVRGLDIGAITWVHSRLVAARDAGAAVLLISEDLDEIMTLSDKVHVMYEGMISPAFARGALDAGALGLWMAGQGFPHHGADASPKKQGGGHAA